ncbi:hypothetical protein L484_016994 [Morus notabilis]|uniref:Uncharacterized protein n=1 Tax=Morus notabilis TaxID=981085 RepID=W9QQW5_9ROSA|nr:hypothetical protein L484_016994 [Morus notabilis]
MTAKKLDTALKPAPFYIDTRSFGPDPCEKPIVYILDQVCEYRCGSNLDHLQKLPFSTTNYGLRHHVDNAARSSVAREKLTTWYSLKLEAAIPLRV